MPSLYPPRVLTVGSPPTGRINDFDLVELDGRTLLIGTPERDRLACAWDLLADEWTEYRLDDPEGDGVTYTDLSAIAAAVVDGRVVIGGGGEHQGFTIWDLESGRLRSSAWDGGVASASRTRIGGRPWFVVGGSSSTNVELWDPALTEADDGTTHPIEAMVEVPELYTASGAASAVAAGMLDRRPVLVAGAHDGGVAVWDIDGNRPVAVFPVDDEEFTDYALVTVDGRVRVVAAGGSQIRCGDAATGEWGEPLPGPDEELECLAAATVRQLPVGVAGYNDGTVCIWDLARGRMLGGPFGERGDRRYGGNRVHAIRVTELDGRPVVITAQNDDAVRVWELPDFGP